MTAQEQMKKMLDELMGTQRDGEYKILRCESETSSNVLTEFEDLARLCLLELLLIGLFLYTD